MYHLSASCLCFWCFYMWSYGRQCPDDYFGHKVWKLWMTRQFLTRDLFLLTHWQETASEQLTPCIGIHVTCYLIQLASTCFCWKVSCVTEALSYGRQCPDDYFGHEVWKLRMTRQFLSRDPLLNRSKVWLRRAARQIQCFGITDTRICVWHGIARLYLVWPELH